MKTFKFVLMWMICMMSISCSAQRTLTELSSIKGVTSVYVGKTMLRLAGASMSLDSDQSAVDISKIIKDLTSIEVVSCQNKNAAEKVQKKCRSILSKYPLELITEVTSDDQNVEISGVFEKDGETLNMILISVTGNESPTYILMKGKINIEALNAALINETEN